tara:strand:- start:113 stop:703 length:591 start_codon:yes stop_codon:yes gene_type:complete
MKQLRQYIRNILIESFGNFEAYQGIIDPPVSEDQRIDELNLIKAQMDSPFNTDETQADLDRNYERLFVELLDLRGIKESEEDLKNISEEIVPAIKKLKKHYNIERPQALADKIDFEIKTDQDTMATAQTESYPSGHTAQAYMIALVLTEKYPHLQTPLMHLAECVAQSRVDRGVHFPSDLKGGKQLALYLFNGGTI